MRRAAFVVALEGVALALLGIGYAASGVLGEPESRAATVLAGVVALAVGAGLVPLSRALERGSGATLAPAVLLQLFTLVVAIGLVRAGVLLVGVPMVVVAVVVLHGLASPASRDVFRDAR